MGGGGVDVEELADLLNMINSTDVWGSKTLDITGNKVAYLSAKDFGKYNKASETDVNQTSQIVVKLLADTDIATNNANSAAAQYWQAVYRSMNSESDVLTLYMCNPYASTIFGSTDANYSASTLRNDVVRPLYETMVGSNNGGITTEGIYKDLDRYVVAPQNILGKWQSSAYQTSYNNSGSLYTYTDSNGQTQSTGLGASGHSSGSPYFEVGNGLDGFNVAQSGWTSQVVSAYSDKLWVPSGFEMLHTGYQPATSLLPSGRNYDGDNVVTTLTGYDNFDATISATSGDDRTGLWELNAYDRAGTGGAWLRSGVSHRVNYAKWTGISGSTSNKIVSDVLYARVALHLDLKQLANDYLTKVTASQKSTNGTSTAVTAITPTIPSALQTNLSTHNYSNYTAPNLIAEKYKRTITFNTVSGANQVKSFTLTSGSITKTINVVGASGSGTRETTKDLCDYSYTYENGQLKVTVSNVQTHILNVQANVDGYTTLNLSVTNSAPNSLLVLHFFNGSDKLGECSFVYSSSAQTASITLPKNETIRILVTKPFTSRAKFELGGDEVPATGTTTWEIKTQTSSTLNLTVTLIGDGSWSNAIVI